MKIFRVEVLTEMLDKKHDCVFFMGDHMDYGEYGSLRDAMMEIWSWDPNSMVDESVYIGGKYVDTCNDRSMTRRPVVRHLVRETENLIYHYYAYVIEFEV